VFFWCNTKFIVESVVPDFFHIVPVGDNTVFDRVLESQDTTFGLGFISDVGCRGIEEGRRRKKKEEEVGRKKQGKVSVAFRKKKDKKNCGKDILFFLSSHFHE
jgi:hypothetical protein